MYLILLIFIETGIQLSIIADSVKLNEVSRIKAAISISFNVQILLFAQLK